jgi:hypothetical protein
VNLFRLLWPSKKEHSKLLENGEETRKELLQMADLSHNPSVECVVKATDTAAEFSH